MKREKKKKDVTLQKKAQQTPHPEDSFAIPSCAITYQYGEIVFKKLGYTNKYSITLLPAKSQP
jgi:hypothetical protein